MCKRDAFIFFLLIALASALPMLAFACNEALSELHRPHPPPQAALDACHGQADDSDCGFVGHLGETVSGTCFTPPHDNTACRPDQIKMPTLGVRS